jgi:hypothetical protein
MRNTPTTQALTQHLAYWTPAFIYAVSGEPVLPAALVAAGGVERAGDLVPLRSEQIVEEPFGGHVVAVDVHDGRLS